VTSPQPPHTPDRFQELIPYLPPSPPQSAQSAPPAESVDTRQHALRTTARFMKGRYQAILALLETRGLCIFEVAQRLSAPNDSMTQSPNDSIVLPHQISGRFSALFDAGLIAKSPATRPTPTGCQAQVYELTLAGLAILHEARTPPSGADALDMPAPAAVVARIEPQPGRPEGSPRQGPPRGAAAVGTPATPTSAAPAGATDPTTENTEPRRTTP
jgi:hypothetical protein